MVIKYRADQSPIGPATGYKLDERESTLLRQLYISQSGTTKMPRETVESFVFANPGMEALIEEVLVLAGLRITEDLTK